MSMFNSLVAMNCDNIVEIDSFLFKKKYYMNIGLNIVDIIV